MYVRGVVSTYRALNTEYCYYTLLCLFVHLGHSVISLFKVNSFLILISIPNKVTKFTSIDF